MYYTSQIYIYIFCLIWWLIFVFLTTIGSFQLALRLLSLKELSNRCSRSASCESSSLQYYFHSQLAWAGPTIGYYSLRLFSFWSTWTLSCWAGTLWIFVYHRSNYEPIDNRRIYFRGLFNNAVSIVVYVAPNISMINELGRIWKATVVAWSRHLRKD